MRHLVQIIVPHEPFNTYVREGTAGAKLSQILEETRPENIYFLEQQGQRSAVAIYEIKKASDLPKFAEPWFLTFNADCHFRVAMTPQDLKDAGLEALGKKWA